MRFNPNFDKYADHWCKKCGAPDSIIAYREKHILEKAPVGYALTENHETILDQSYECSSCGAESNELEDLMTENQYEAHSAFCNSQKIGPIALKQTSEDEDEEIGE